MEGAPQPCSLHRPQENRYISPVNTNTVNDVPCDPQEVQVFSVCSDSPGQKMMLTPV